MVIAVDVDDTVADLVTPWLARYNRDFDDTLEKESITSWDIARGFQQENAGRKDDNGKARVDLIPVRPLFYLADVFTRGADKYEDHNWRKGLAWHRVFSALMRHALAWWAGEKLDGEDGQHHLASAAWCSMVLMEYELTHPELDDRVCQTNDLEAIRHGKFGQ